MCEADANFMNYINIYIVNKILPCIQSFHLLFFYKMLQRLLVAENFIPISAKPQVLSFSRIINWMKVRY